MAIIDNSILKGTMTFEEFRESVVKDIDASSVDSIISLIPNIKKVANNKLFFIDFINEGLKNYKSFQNENNYSSQSMLLHRENGIMIRANFWFPQEIIEDYKKNEKIYIYDRAHCHNFNLLTVGLHGPGYKTKIYNYDRNSIKGFIGEEVKICFQGEYTLSEGNIILFEKSKDIHVQYHPDDISISLNVMEDMGRSIANDQYFFDLKTSKIVEVANYLAAEELIKMASILGDDNTLDILSELRTKNINKRVTKATEEAIFRIKHFQQKSVI